MGARSPMRAGLFRLFEKALFTFTPLAEYPAFELKFHHIGSPVVSPRRKCLSDASNSMARKRRPIGYVGNHGASPPPFRAWRSGRHLFGGAPLPLCFLPTLGWTWTSTPGITILRREDPRIRENSGFFFDFGGIRPHRIPSVDENENAVGHIRKRLLLRLGELRAKAADGSLLSRSGGSLVVASDPSRAASVYSYRNLFHHPTKNDTVRSSGFLPRNQTDFTIALFRSWRCPTPEIRQ